MAKAANLSIDQQKRLKEYFKCKNDPIYFMENYIKLAVAGGDTCVKLYDRQKDFVDMISNDHFVISCKSRQTGVSTISQMYAAYVMCFFKNVIIGIASKSGAESTDFCRKVIAMIESIPEWLQPKFTKKTEQTFILDNGCQFYASQINEANPGSLFRGKAITILIIDEAGFIPRIDEAYTSCAPTLFKSQTTAKANGIPYATIVISTPNKTVGMGKWYYQTWTDAINGESIFKPFKLHWKMIKEFADDPQWYPTQCQLLGNVHWKIAQELDMQFVASNNSFFPAEIIEKLNTCHRSPLHTMTLFNKHEIWQFEQPQPNKFYLIAIDTASSGGSDSSTIVVMDYEEFVQVGEFRGKLRVDDFCKIIYLINKIYPNNLIIPESNSYGNQVCEYLTNSGTYYNIYKTKMKSHLAGDQAPVKLKYGLSTNPQNRPLMLDALYTYISENPNIVRSERLALELIGLIDNGRGKVAADEGEHDDLAMALAFSAYVRMYDPPMAFAKELVSKESVQDFAEIASWNDNKIHVNSAEIPEIFGFESDDRRDRADHTNKLIDKYVRNNLPKMLNKDGSTIDVLKLLDFRNKKN